MRTAGIIGAWINTVIGCAGITIITLGSACAGNSHATASIPIITSGAFIPATARVGRGIIGGCAISRSPGRTVPGLSIRADRVPAGAGGRLGRASVGLRIGGAS